MARMCAVCGGEAGLFGKYAMCTKCVDEAIEHYVEEEALEEGLLGEALQLS